MRVLHVELVKQAMTCGRRGLRYSALEIDDRDRRETRSLEDRDVPQSRGPLLTTFSL